MEARSVSGAAVAEPLVAVEEVGDELRLLGCRDLPRPFDEGHKAEGGERRSAAYRPVPSGVWRMAASERMAAGSSGRRTSSRSLFLFRLESRHREPFVL